MDRIPDDYAIRSTPRATALPTPRPVRAVTTRERVIGEGVTWLSRWTLRWVVIAAGAVLLGYAVQQLWIILLPVALAMLLTSVLQPPALFLERQWHFPPALAAVTTILATLAGLVGVGLAIAPSIGTQVADIATSASDGLDTVEQWARESRFNITHTQIDAVVSAAQDRLQSSASRIATGVLVGVSAVTSALLNLLLTLVLTFFLLKDGRHFLPWLRGLTGPRVGGHLAEVGSRAWDTLGGFVRTQALVGLIDAVLIGLGLVVVGVPLAVPLIVLTFVAAFAPIVGAVTVGALAVLVALVANGWVSALIILGVVLVVQQLEGNLFLPWLQGKRLDLHAGVVLLAVVLGSSLFGVTGAFLAVPVAATGAIVVRYLSEIADRRVEDGPVEDGPVEHGPVEDGPVEHGHRPGRTGSEPSDTDRPGS